MTMHGNMNVKFYHFFHLSNPPPPLLNLSQSLCFTSLYVKRIGHMNKIPLSTICFFSWFLVLSVVK